MVIAGRVENGVVVLPSGTKLPEGAEVTVSVSLPANGQRDAMVGDWRQRHLAALARIDAIPDESPTDTFSGADHDRVLYGDAE